MSVSPHEHEAVNVRTLPRREYVLPIVPIPQVSTGSVTIIASTNNAQPDEIDWYIGYLMREFGNDSREGKVDVVIADNTGDGSLMKHLQPHEVSLQRADIGCVFRHVPTPGKIHGLNECLRHTRGEFVVSVDLNKRPHDGTLRGIAGMVRNGVADLVSAQIFALNPLKPPQWWCAGGAYAATRKSFPGFPPVLNEDEYTGRLNRARGGSFTVSEYFITDTKGRGQIHPNHRAIRAARTTAGGRQFENLIINDNARCYNLGNFPAPRVPRNIGSTLFNFSTSLRAIAQLSPSEARIIGKRALSSIIQRTLQPKSSGSIYDSEYEKWMGLLHANPEMCSWT